jgi:hypothetical protein
VICVCGLHGGGVELVVVPPPAFTPSRIPRSAVVKGLLSHFLYFFFPFFFVLDSLDALYSEGGSHVIATEVDVSADANG